MLWYNYILFKNFDFASLIYPIVSVLTTQCTPSRWDTLHFMWNKYVCSSHNHHQRHSMKEKLSTHFFLTALPAFDFCDRLWSVAVSVVYYAHFYRFDGAAPAGIYIEQLRVAWCLLKSFSFSNDSLRRHTRTWRFTGRPASSTAHRPPTPYRQIGTSKAWCKLSSNRRELADSSTQSWP